MTGVMKDLRYLVDLTYHDLRHEATSRLAKVYKSKEDLKRVTGHRDLKSLDRYYQPDMTELAMIAEEYELARRAGVALPTDVEKATAD
jgi:integrase